ncbi:MAG: hypothetical protein ACKVQR_07400 [Aquabacterium sp.]
MPNKTKLLIVLAAAATAGCAAGVGFSIPVGSIGSIGVGVDSEGRVTGGVAVGRGGVSVGVGGSTTLPRAPAASEASSATLPASAASAARR